MSADKRITKNDIVEKSLTLLLQKGTSVITMQEIIDASGVGKGSFYHFFDNERKLFLAVIQESIKDIEESLDGIINNENIITSIENAFGFKFNNIFKFNTATYVSDFMKTYINFWIPPKEKIANNFSFYKIHFIINSANSVQRLFPNEWPAIYESSKRCLDKRKIFWKHIIKMAMESKGINTGNRNIQTEIEKTAEVFIRHFSGESVNALLDTREEQKETLRNKLLAFWNQYYAALADPVSQETDIKRADEKLDIDSLTAVMQDGLILEHISEAVQTPEICKAAVMQNGLALRFVIKQTPLICLIAVTQNGLALEYVESQSPEIISAAVRQNPQAIKFKKANA
jgi:AcrR family transcriptional regulator